jgi:outer membrane protein OmpA-like peptidoglycan-associated protein
MAVSGLSRALLIALGCMALMAIGAQADEVAGSKDHPLVGRYKDASIVYYKASDFDELVFLKAPHDYGALLERNATDDRSGPEWLKLQGRATEVRYEVPAGRSSLEVFTNYDLALKGKGFETVFRCADKACFTGSVNDLYLLEQQLDPTNGVSTAYSGHARYLLAKLDRPEGYVYTSVFAGEENGQTVVFLRVLEAKSMETDRIVAVKAQEMKSDLETTGRINLYGIQFDFDQATIKPESKPTLDEIAKLLAEKPDLRLDIVGHTDGQGTEAYNLDLSNRRAANVVAALVGTYAIDQERLSSRGAGMSQPIAPNNNEEGRAKNRRVELIAK